MSKLVCYLDLDGVLVDFVAGALKIHNSDLHHTKIQYDFYTQLGLDPTAFYAPMGHDFWANLPWTPEGKELLKGVEDIFGDDVVIMTSPTDTKGCPGGKTEWINREIPRYRRKHFIGPPKHLAAAPTKILVDDYEKNTTNFINHSGNALLVPRPWNKLSNKLDEHGKFNVEEVIKELQVLISWLSVEN